MERGLKCALLAVPGEQSSFRARIKRGRGLRQVLKEGKFSVAVFSPPCLKHNSSEGRTKALSVSWGTYLWQEIQLGAVCTICA